MLTRRVQYSPSMSVACNRSADKHAETHTAGALERQKRQVDNNPCFVVFCRGETTRAATSPQTSTSKKEPHLHKRSTMDSGARCRAHSLMICCDCGLKKVLKAPAGFWGTCRQTGTAASERASHGTAGGCKREDTFFVIRGEYFRFEVLRVSSCKNISVLVACAEI